MSVASVDARCNVPVRDGSDLPFRECILLNGLMGQGLSPFVDGLLSLLFSGSSTIRQDSLLTVSWEARGLAIGSPFSPKVKERARPSWERRRNSSYAFGQSDESFICT